MVTLIRGTTEVFCDDRANIALLCRPYNVINTVVRTTVSRNMYGNGDE